MSPSVSLRRLCGLSLFSFRECLLLSFRFGIGLKPRNQDTVSTISLKQRESRLRQPRPITPQGSLGLILSLYFLWQLDFISSHLYLHLCLCWWFSEAFLALRGPAETCGPLYFHRKNRCRFLVMQEVLQITEGPAFWFHTNIVHLCIQMRQTMLFAFFCLDELYHSRSRSARIDSWGRRLLFAAAGERSFASLGGRLFHLMSKCCRRTWCKVGSHVLGIDITDAGLLPTFWTLGWICWWWTSLGRLCLEFSRQTCTQCNRRLEERRFSGQ